MSLLCGRESFSIFFALSEFFLEFPSISENLISGACISSVRIVLSSSALLFFFLKAGLYENDSLDGDWLLSLYAFTFMLARFGARSGQSAASKDRYLTPVREG